MYFEDFVVMRIREAKAVAVTRWRKYYDALYL
jgi:hypothetical protein